MLTSEHTRHTDPGKIIESRTKPNRIGNAAGTGFELVRNIVVDGTFKGYIPDHVAASVVRFGRT